MNRILEIKEKLERKELELIQSRILIEFYSNRINQYTEDLRNENKNYRYYHILIDWMRKRIIQFTEKLVHYRGKISILEEEIRGLNLELTSIIISNNEDLSFRLFRPTR